jgi:hypothetical protein
MLAFLLLMFLLTFPILGLHEPRPHRGDWPAVGYPTT